MSHEDIVLQRSLERYGKEIKDATFNGVKLQDINEGIDDISLRTAVERLVSNRKLDVICSETQLNPHIKRTTVRSVEIQLAYLNTNEKYHTCLYPTPEQIAESYDLSFLNTRPFTRSIAQGDPQLKAIFFELGVLDRYRLDPRYLFEYSEYAGRISMMSESDRTGPIPERDQTFIQTFGLGLDKDQNPHVCVFLRYLSQLSPEHQRHWETYLSADGPLMHENYYRPSILGEFWENNSGIEAMRFSISSINKICEEIWSGKLFLNVVPNTVHYNLSPFMRTTKADYLSFAHELDKILSENINLKFFDGKIDRYSVTAHADGTVERKQKGSLALLDEWLFQGTTIPQPELEEARKQMIEPLRKVRRERQSAAHAVIQNEFDLKYSQKRRELLRDAAFAIGNIFYLIRAHPKSPEIRVPRWFDEGRIEVI
jgi:hypothetical protein